MGALDGKVAIITGASSGIGRAAALLFAREGAAVVAGARRADALAAVVADIEAVGGRAVSVPGDVREEAAAEQLVATAVARFGGLDIALNNAGALGEMGPAHEVSAEGWSDALAVNLTGAFFGAKHQARAMLERGGGSIVFTSSFVGTTVGFPGMAAYAAAKAGLMGLTQVLAAELGPSGVRANVLLAGAADTPMGRSVADTQEARDFIASLYALKRIAQPEEIARAALFLASDAASYVTGAAIPVEGGVSIART